MNGEPRPRTNVGVTNKQAATPICRVERPAMRCKSQTGDVEDLPPKSVGCTDRGLGDGLVVAAGFSVGDSSGFVVCADETG